MKVKGFRCRVWGQKARELLRLYLGWGRLGISVPIPRISLAIAWVAVKELKLSCYLGETLLFTIYTHYGN